MDIKQAKQLLERYRGGNVGLARRAGPHAR